MHTSLRRALAAAVVLAALVLTAGAAQAAVPEKAAISVTNTQDQRVAYCTLLIDGRAQSKLAIRPGKTWSDAFDPRREILLVCDRATSLRFGPLKAGTRYRLVESEGAKIQLTEDGPS
ncbi:MAG: hypothetical protein KKE02_02640 [Alphaproteobacteria bacterium]|nr:hypothetical protein [Alphaproteobacteria bacterium]MBU1513424.1 hypothetical protein [Alphaproteobacteria bacterium]MBU2096416.1 hypothetical protein [Alphaproteobacteria bacterium]MBU2149892.1 hypothetical protein [Alphaproteobacteria bacterium]MBU2308202.1 hypothetical protein [Alphaproteobacteria bacterium]